MRFINSVRVKSLACLLVIIALVCLSGCGQKGDLILPSEAQQSEQQQTEQEEE